LVGAPALLAPAVLALPALTCPDAAPPSLSELVPPAPDGSAELTAPDELKSALGAELHATTALRHRLSAAAVEARG
jgi:hypothetical protein